ncbi:hypothetical protein [Nocardioides pakistanensis]
MTTLAAAHSRPRQRSRADQACAVLLKVAMADGWQAETAARTLLDEIHEDPRLLRILRARVSRAMLLRPTAIANRAAATLECAVALPLARCA